MLSFILLQANGGSNPLMGNILLIGGILLIFYFFMIRPQQKKQKDQRKFLEAVKKGDNVVTLGGIHGRVQAIDDKTVILEVEKGGKIKFERSSISLEATKKSIEGK